MIRVGEIELDTGGRFDVLVVMELGAVVGCDRLESARQLLDSLNRTIRQDVLSTVNQLADGDVAGLALAEGDDAVLAALAHDGIDFPVPKLLPPLDGCRPFRDMALAGQAPAAVVGAVALSSLLG